MISLSDSHLRIVMTAAGGIPVEKRSKFLQRIAAMLALRGRGHFTDGDVGDAVRLALVEWFTKALRDPHLTQSGHGA